MQRVEKLELLCKAGIRLRKKLLDPQPKFFLNLFAPRAAVAEFDATVESLKQTSNADEDT